MGKNTTNNCETCGKPFNPGKHKEKKNCSSECLKTYQEVNKQSRLQKSKEGVFRKHGVWHISQTKNFTTKVKATKKENYGDENYNNRAKAKRTTEEKYGVENTMQLPETVIKSKNTKKQKYGDENFNNRIQAQETCMTTYGSEHHMMNRKCIDKMKRTNIKKHGVSWTIESEKAKKNRGDVMNDKYNCDWFFESDKYKNETKEKKIERINKILAEGNIEFDVNSYEKIRNKLPDGSVKYIQYPVRCLDCGYEFTTRFVNKIPICRKCNPLADNSSFQLGFRNFLTEINIQFEERDRTIIKPYELDFVATQFNIAFELNGNYYHSEIGGNKGKKYHLEKTIKCNNAGIKLIHICEDEWISKNSIVKSRVKNMLGITETRIYARKCTLKEVDHKQKTNFLINNHIQGNSVDSYRFGLFYNEELVSIMTFSKTRLATGNKHQDSHWELNRFCSTINYNVVGGFEKLLKHFVKNIKFKSIITYADCRWSGLNYENTVYNKCGFKFIAKTPPSYFYVFTNDYYYRFHRFSFNKQKLLSDFGGSSLMTEWELAQTNGLDRIWDCGTMKFELTQ